MNGAHWGFKGSVMVNGTHTDFDSTAFKRFNHA